MKKEGKYTISYSKTKCDFEKCPTALNGGITLNNFEPYFAFPEMKKGQWMHLECYIRHCVERAIKNNQAPNNQKRNKEMKIPNKIKIGGKTYEVIVGNLRKETAAGEMSMVQPAWQRIWISNEMTKEQQESSFLHEIVEVIKFDNDLELNHQTLQTLVEQLYQVLKDNNLLKEE